MKLRNPWSTHGVKKAVEEVIQKVLAKHEELRPVIRKPVDEAISECHSRGMNGEQYCDFTARHKNVQVTAKGNNQVEVITFTKVV